MVNEQNSVLYNPLDYLKTPEACANYLEAALEDGDERVLSLALQNVTTALSASMLSETLPLSHQQEDTLLRNTNQNIFGSDTFIKHRYLLPEQWMPC